MGAKVVVRVGPGRGGVGDEWKEYSVVERMPLAQVTSKVTKELLCFRSAQTRRPRTP